jgi:hypothetical protein
MKTVAGFLMIANAALLFFGIVQHAGVVIGPLREPVIQRGVLRSLPRLALWHC